MVKYIGSKRVLLPRIVTAISAFPGVRTVLDLFSGTSRVGHGLKRVGFYVLANDHNAYAHTLARCYVQADRRRVWHDGQRLIREFAALPPRPGYFTETFCVRARFFHPRNGARIDAIREAIAKGSFEPNLEAVLLTALMEAADRVDSTTGVQMAYLKEWAPRALHDLELRMPEVLPGEGKAFCLDAQEAARSLESDIAYLDPPYNQHSYLGNYHVWETLVRWDKPESYGVACKRMGCKTYRSDFNSRRRIQGALASVIDAVRAPHLVVSFNDEGYVSRAEMEGLLSRRGHVEVVEIDFPRYVGARIGIFNPAGIKVGKVGRLRNKERLFIVSEERARARAAAGR
jgi:adenine-specific DNA-methyltransferase